VTERIPYKYYLKKRKRKKKDALDFTSKPSFPIQIEQQLILKLTQINQSVKLWNSPSSQAVKKHFRVRFDEYPFQHQTQSQMSLSKLPFPAKIHTEKRKKESQKIEAINLALKVQVENRA